MNELDFPSNNHTLSSIEVAEMVEKEHNMLLRDIRRYIGQLGKSKIAQSDFFTETTYQNSQNKTMPCYFVTKKGCEFIANKLTGVKGVEFTARYINKFHELEDNSLPTKLLNTLSFVVNSLKIFDERLSKIEETKDETLKLPILKRPYNPWFAKMQPKYDLLEDYFQTTRGQIYKNILLELENIYHLDTRQIQADCCYENGIETCYPLEPYEFKPKYREMIETIVNENLIKFGIADEGDPIVSTKHVTIFNTSNI